MKGRALGAGRRKPAAASAGFLSRQSPRWAPVPQPGGPGVIFPADELGWTSAAANPQHTSSGALVSLRHHVPTEDTSAFIHTSSDCQRASGFFPLPFPFPVLAVTLLRTGAAPDKTVWSGDLVWAATGNHGEEDPLLPSPLLSCSSIPLGFPWPCLGQEMWAQGSSAQPG